MVENIVYSMWTSLEWIEKQEICLKVNRVQVRRRLSETAEQQFCCSVPEWEREGEKNSISNRNIHETQIDLWTQRVYWLCDVRTSSGINLVYFTDCREQRIVNWQMHFGDSACSRRTKKRENCEFDIFVIFLSLSCSYFFWAFLSRKYNVEFDFLFSLDTLAHDSVARDHCFVQLANDKRFKRIHKSR